MLTIPVCAFYCPGKGYASHPEDFVVENVWRLCSQQSVRNSPCNDSVLEGMNLIHNPVAGAAELAGVYGTGRALTSQGVVDAMTRPGQPRSGPITPSGAGAGRMIPLSALLNAGKRSEEDEVDAKIRASRRGEYF